MWQIHCSKTSSLVFDSRWCMQKRTSAWGKGC